MGCNPILGVDSIVFNENSIASVVTFTLTDSEWFELNCVHTHPMS